MTAEELVGLQVKAIIGGKEVITRVVGFNGLAWAIIAYDGGKTKDNLQPGDTVVFDCTGYAYREVDNLVVTDAARLSAGNYLADVPPETPLSEFLYPTLPDPDTPPAEAVESEPPFIEVL